MITVRMDEQDAIDLLVERVKYWTDDDEIIDLFEEYYTNMVEGGCFDGADFDVMSIVDNDYVNNTSIVTREEFEKDRDEYIQDELKDKLEDLEEDDETTEEELREGLEEDTPTWEDLERGENTLSFLRGYYIEAIKGDSMLVV
jgi:hypothetical protein